MDNVHLFLIDIWLVFLGLFLAFYVVLDGFDLGIGVLSLFVREDERRGIMMASLSSVWDANETWLVVLGGALFGAFPVAYAIILNALYLPIIVMIFALIFAASPSSSASIQERRRLWDFAFGLGSLIAALVPGLYARRADRRADRSRRSLRRRAVRLVLAVLGAGRPGRGVRLCAARRDLSDRQDRRCGPATRGSDRLDRRGVDASRRRGRFDLDPDSLSLVADKWFGGGLISGFIVPPIFALFCSAMLAHALWKRHEHAPFVWSIGIFLASLIGLASSLYPYLVPAAVTRGRSRCRQPHVVFMMTGIGMLIPVMIAYNAYQYVVFRGKVTGPHYG